MDDKVCDLTKIQKEHQENIRAKLTKFTSNEISFYNAPFPEFFDLNDAINQQKSQFIDQFLNLSPCFDPKLYSDRIKYKFSKEFAVQDKSEMINFFHSQINHIKWRNEAIYNRINKPETLPLFSNYYPLYLESTSKYSEECSLAIQSLQSESPDYRYIETIIKYDYFHRFCHFHIDNLFYTFKKFSLIRRSEILSLVKESLVKDLIFDLSSTSIPTIINQSDNLINELKRLSSLLDIEFDIYAQDGQHFSYSCEKLYYKTANQTVSFDCMNNSIPEIKYPSFLDRLNDKFIKNTQIDENISFSFDNLVNPNDTAMDDIIKKFDNAMIKELTRDKVTAFIRLQFCRNKTILHSIVESIKSIEKVAKEILNEDMEDFFNYHFSIFRKITLVVASSVKSKSNISSIDNDSLLEIVLDLYDQFYKYKVKVLNSLREINFNSQKINISSITKKFIEFRPDLIAGNHKSCIQPFQLSVNILKQISAAVQGLINLQILTQNEFQSIYGHYYPWFEFAEIEPKYQLANQSFPYSIFQIFPFVKKVVEFLKVSREVILEVTESFSVRSTRYKPYFEYAIWSQLLNEMSSFITNLTPESFNFNMKITEKVSSAMTSPYLDDLDFILKVINDSEEKNKLKFVTNFRNMILLGWKLQSFLVKSDICMKIYQTQLSKLEAKNDPQVTDFAYGDYAFSAISHDWNSTELEKIVTAQHRYHIALEVAVRFNNYHLDVDTIKRTLEMGQFESSLPHKAKIDQINRYKSIKALPSLLFYEPELFDEKQYSPLFCYITAAKEFTDAKYVSDIFLPYCIRSEIAFICILERCFLKTYSSYDVFYTSSNPKETFIDSSNKFNHFLVPTTPQALLLDRNIDILYQVLRFISIRYQLLKYTMHDNFLSHIKSGDLEEIYEEKLLWSSNLFPRLYFELHRTSQCDDTEFSVNYINQERELFCSKQLMIVLSVLNFSVLPKKEDKKHRNDEETETYTFESVQSYLIDMNRPLTGTSSFMDSSLYAQTYLDQFMYQCNDALRTEFVNYKSIIEKQVGDSIVGFPEDQYNEAMHEFSMESIRFSFMRLGIFYLDHIKDPQKVTINSIIANLTKEILLEGIEKYDNDSSIQATYKTDMNPKCGTLEMSFLKAKIQVALSKLEKLNQNYQIQIFTDQFQKEKDSVESVFNSPTSVLKPECYSERIPMKSSQQIFIPPIPSIKNQFSEEVQYARSRFCRILCNCISKTKRKEGSDDEEFVIMNSNELKESVIEFSGILWNFFNASDFRMMKTWKGYIQNMLYNLKKSSDEQEEMNVFIEYFTNRFNNSVHFDLSRKLKDNYIKIAHLRDQEKVINQEQERFEKQETQKIRKEFDLLVRDLNDEIHKAKLRFVQAKNKFFNASFNSINKIKDDPTYVDKCVLPPLTDKPPKPQQPKQEETKPEKIEEKDENKEEVKAKEENDEKIKNEEENNDNFSNLDATEIKDDLTETKIDLSASEIKDNEGPNVSFAPETFEQKTLTQNELEATEVEAFPSFSHQTDQNTQQPSIVISSQQDPNTIMLTATDKTAVIANTTEEAENQKTDQQQQPEEEEEQNDKNEEEEEEENHDGDETKPISMPSSDKHSNPRRMNLRKSSPNNENLAKSTGNAALTARRSINLRKLQSQKMKAKKQANTTLQESSIQDISASSSLASFNVSSESNNDQLSQQKPREMIMNVADRIELTKKQIEELQELRKKLRISTTLSALAVKGIYSARIAKVAEERKNYSATLWRGRRLLEEDLKEKNNELKEAYRRLNDADVQIESLQEEIAKIKEANVKLLHMKELNIRQVDLIHKELKKVNVNTDINVAKLVRKISQKQEELEILILQQQEMEETIYYQIKEPMMQLDQMRRTLTIRRGQLAEERYIMKQQQQTENLNEEEDQEAQLSIQGDDDDDENDNLDDNDQQKSNDEMDSGSIGSTLSSFRSTNKSMSIGEQIKMKLLGYKEENEELRQENDELKKQILEIERQISELPESRKQIISNLFQPEVKSSRPKSYKTIIKPGVKKSTTKRRLRPLTARNYS